MEDAAMITARRKKPENMSAFECLLRGIEHHRLGGVLEEHSREAVKWFTRAIELDPSYAAAYAWRVCAASDLDRKSTRLNSSHANISYAVFCLKKKKQYNTT